VVCFRYGRIVGSRRPNRTATESVVPVILLKSQRLLSTLGQPDVNQMLQYVAPSFNSNKHQELMVRTTLIRQPSVVLDRSDPCYLLTGNAGTSHHWSIFWFAWQRQYGNWLKCYSSFSNWSHWNFTRWGISPVWLWCYSRGLLISPEIKHRRIYCWLYIRIQEFNSSV